MIKKKEKKLSRIIWMALFASYYFQLHNHFVMMCISLTVLFVNFLIVTNMECPKSKIFWFCNFRSTPGLCWHIWFRVIRRTCCPAIKMFLSFFIRIGFPRTENRQIMTSSKAFSVQWSATKSRLVFICKKKWYLPLANHKKILIKYGISL